MNTRTRKASIGILDSGFGELSVLREIMRQLPQEHLIYFGDNKNCPYGDKSRNEIRTLTIRIVDYLLNRGCKMIVVACNTMTTNVIDQLRTLYHVPFVGVEPAIKVAARLTKTKNIGVLATKGTFIGEKYLKTKETINNDITVHTQVGIGLVELVENGFITESALQNTLYQYLDFFRNNSVDQIVLGCTHYPFLIDYMQAYIGESIGIINPAPAVARQVQSRLSELNFENARNTALHYEFLTSHHEFALTRFIPEITRFRHTITTNVVL